MPPATPDADFAALVGPHRRGLLVHCYRMLGSPEDAEDALQETLAAAWAARTGFDGREPRAWLYRIATNRCLNAARAARRRPAAPAPPFDVPVPSRRADVTWLGPMADAGDDPAARAEARAGIELAFVEALQRLPPRQTAALVLCDVLGFDAAEAGDMLGTGATSVKGALQRVRAGMGGVDRRRHRPRDAAAEAHVARRFADAFARDDIDALRAMLTDDAWLSMPPAPHVYDGPAAIAGFLAAGVRARGGRTFALRPAWANAQPAFALTRTTPGGAHVAAGLIVLTVRGDAVLGVTRFLGR